MPLDALWRGHTRRAFLLHVDLDPSLVDVCALGSLVARSGDDHAAPVLDPRYSLYDSLAKGLHPDALGAAIILERGGEDLRYRRRLAVDEQVERRRDVEPILVRLVLDPVEPVVCDRRDLCILRKQEPRHVDAAREVAPRVLPKVDHEALCALGL